MSQPDRTKILDRIQKLMRLATNNPNEQEASCAAVQAVKLIVEYQFEFVKSIPPPEQPVAKQPVDDILAALRRHQQEQQDHARDAYYEQWDRAWRGY